ncbi:MAG TPA: DEAD/DEAH box helicase [Actinocrinis sp.]|nr:DEAD/DEAH box helicase [Actinocrinis sp.]
MNTQPSASFTELGLPESLAKALAEAGILTPFPIQTATLPDALAGRDVLGRGRTGSGKTLAFVLPVLARLAEKPGPRRPNRPRALILAPTRELAAQIHATLLPLAAKLKINSTTVFGGVGANPQISALRGGIDVLIACPGRLADHVQTGHAILDAVEITVLDEADHMADMGFLPVVKRLLDQTPKTGQRLLFSATLDNEIDVLVKRYLNKPVTHSVDSAQSPVTAMEHHVLHIEADHRLAILTDLAAAPDRTIVFTRTKHGAKKLTRQLLAANIPAVELHGNLAQNARSRNLAAFAAGQATTLVATDIAARGIHVDDVTLVVHADPPTEHKAYLHRSGRTARAGAEGMVITLMTDAQQAEVRDLTRKAGIKPTTTRIRPGDGQLARLVPGERVYGALPAAVAAAEAAEAEDAAGGGRQRGGQAGGRSARQPGVVKQGGRRRSGGQGASAQQDGGQQPRQATEGGRTGARQQPARQAADRHAGTRPAEQRQGEPRQGGAKKPERTGQGAAKQGVVKQGGPRQGGAKQGGSRQRGSGGGKQGGPSTALSYSTSTPGAVVHSDKPARSGAVALSEAASRRMGSPRRASGAGRAK